MTPARQIFRDFIQTYKTVCLHTKTINVKILIDDNIQQ